MTFEVKLKASSTPIRKGKRKKVSCLIHINNSLNAQMTHLINQGQRASQKRMKKAQEQMWLNKSTLKQRRLGFTRSKGHN